MSGQTSKASSLEHINPYISFQKINTPSGGPSRQTERDLEPGGKQHVKVSLPSQIQRINIMDSALTTSFFERKALPTVIMLPPKFQQGRDYQEPNYIHKKPRKLISHARAKSQLNKPVTQM